MCKKNVKFALMVMLVAMTAAANAQIRPAYQYPESGGRGAMQLGSSPFFITPYIGFAAGRDDNLFFASSTKRSSSYWVLSPGFTLDARTGKGVFSVKYQGQVGRYPQSDDDRYVDHTSRALFDYAFDRRNFIRVGLDYIRAHDPRGSTDRPIAGRPDIYQQVTPNATYAFGAPGAAGRIEVYAAESDKRYQNNRETTRFSDRETREFGGAFYFRVAPKTYSVIEARHTDIGYRDPAATASSDERRYFGGIAWEATAATIGTLKVGRFERNFDQDGDDFSSTAWEGSIGWSPRTYSKFDFYTSRTSNESTGLGRFILSSIGGISWNHAWNSALSTGVDLRYQKDQYQGISRTDKTKSLGLKAGYKFRRWLTLGAEFSHSTRDSSQPTFEYDKNLYLVTATASM